MNCKLLSADELSVPRSVQSRSIEHWPKYVFYKNYWTQSFLGVVGPSAQLISKLFDNLKKNFSSIDL
jgi:hypothetical protein